MYPPDVTHMEEEPVLFRRGIDCFLDAVPAVEIFLHTSSQRALFAVHCREMFCEALTDEVAFDRLALSAFRAEVAMSVARARGEFPDLGEEFEATVAIVLIGAFE